MERVSYAKGNVGAKGLRLKELTCMCTRNWNVVSPRVQNEGLLSAHSLPQPSPSQSLTPLLPDCPS